MKRFSLIFILFLTACVGFFLGRFTGSDSLLVNTNQNRDFPLFPAPPKSSPVVKSSVSAKLEKDIIVEEPIEGTNVSDTFLVVSGRAKKGEILQVFVKDEKGIVLADTTLAIEADSNDGYGRFGKTIAFENHPLGRGTVEIFRKINGDEPKEKIIRTIIFGDDAVVVKAFFTQGQTDICSVVFPVERKVSRKNSIYRAVLDELLKGPTVSEKKDGFTTLLPMNVVLKSVAADANGVVTADFSSVLRNGVAGSCRVEAIRAQIEATLKQFPEVHDVVISVNGKFEDVLQP